VDHRLRLWVVAGHPGDVGDAVYDGAPQIWKKAFSLGKDKEQTRLRAQQLFPGTALRRKKDHGRAEALLLALYGQRQVKR